MGALSIFSPFLPDDKSSFSFSVCAQWSSEPILSPFKDTLVSSGSSGVAVSLCLWWVVYIFPKDLLSVFFEVCSSYIGLLSLAPILGFSSSHKKYKHIAFKNKQIVNYFNKFEYKIIFYMLAWLNRFALRLEGCSQFANLPKLMQFNPICWVESIFMGLWVGLDCQKRFWLWAKLGAGQQINKSA